MVRNVEGAGGGVRLPLAGPEPNARNLGASFAARHPFMLTREGARRTPPARSPLPNAAESPNQPLSIPSGVLTA